MPLGWGVPNPMETRTSQLCYHAEFGRIRSHRHKRRRRGGAEGQLTPTCRQREEASGIKCPLHFAHLVE